SSHRSKSAYYENGFGCLPHNLRVPSHGCIEQPLGIDGLFVLDHPHIIRGDIIDDDESAVDRADLEFDIEELEALRLQIPANHLGRLADQSFRLLYLVKGHQAQRLDGLVDNEGVAPLVVFESDFHQAAQWGAFPCVLAIAVNKTPKGLEADDKLQPVPRRFFGDERPLAYVG